ncbi:hypothetical protein CYLTODRAFT_420323 [Cylindrobasidium torrendii FP15055 ss-10]|uniref:DUF6699 domain-containing protein n=1 Tax=Cylindrobasidium torrendii FP15055 ss-10 TaxID=1314674 RepID=A0A0D7BHE9_9AGAR|nr:hypothetical protein CYLTODRAFT_420323 [Cylindrobasidium torrendii FP15055 ss-10]
MSSTPSPKPHKQVRFTDSPNSTFAYESDGAPSPVITRRRLSTSLPVPTSPPYRNFGRSDDQSSLSPVSPLEARMQLDMSPPFSGLASQLPATPERVQPNQRSNLPTASSLLYTPGNTTVQPRTSAQTHGRNNSASSTTSTASSGSSSSAGQRYQPPPTPMMQPIALPPLEALGDGGPGSLASLPTDLHLSLHGGQLAFDLSLDNARADALIAQLPYDPATLPLKNTMVLVSKLLPWKVHVSSASADVAITVQHVVWALHRWLRTRVTNMETRMAGNAVNRAFARRANGDQNEPIRRVDFLMQNTVFSGLVATEVPDEWKICLSPTQEGLTLSTSTQ